jgi:hypothetical protein
LLPWTVELLPLFAFCEPEFAGPAPPTAERLLKNTACADAAVAAEIELLDIIRLPRAPVAQETSAHAFET